MFEQLKSSSQLKVDGKMTPKGADRVGLLQAIAWLITAIAFLIAVIGFFFIGTK